MQHPHQLRSFVIGCLALSAAALGPGATLAQAETVTLKMVGAWSPSISPMAEVGTSFMNAVNRLSEGRLEVKYMGAEDVVPTFDQPAALQNGVFDVWYGAPNYWASIVPAGYVTELSSLETPDGGPGSELHDFMVSVYEPHGIRYLGHASGAVGYGAHYVFTQKKIESLDDFKGLKFRVPPLTRHFAVALGAESVTLPPSDIFLAVDRGTVDGFTWPVSDGFTNYGWQTVTKYMIDAPVYRSGVSLAMNLDAWNRLPEDLQAIVLKAVEETQTSTRSWIVTEQDNQIKKMQEAGMELLSLSEENTAKWRDLSREALWKYFETVIDKDQFEKARALLDE